ncbi:MAG: serine/threonine protein kinase [Bacteroidetes bacterium]|nr:serine/threonine protein kinase [Bacteroidota bacterium]
MPFNIEEKISESNFTSVYRAFDTVLKRNVLLKVLHKHHAADNDLYQRFVREAQACAALRSEHIVQVYGLIEYEGSPAIVMEYIEGTSLKNLIGTGTTRSLKYARKVALHTLRGLVAAHEKEIIHRDIKPGNILVLTDGTLKVSDFGLAYVASVPTITAQGMVLGTPAYMSPEQIKHEVVDQRTDLFSMGVTLTEVLTGDRLFDGTSYAECAKKIISFKVGELDHLVEKSSIEFVEFLKLLLAPDKNKRYSTSKDALYALEQDESKIFIYPPGVLHKREKRTLFLMGLIVLASLLMITLFMFIHFTTYKSYKPEQPAVPADTVSYIQSDSYQQSAEAAEKEYSKTSAVPVPEDSGAVFLTSTPWAKVYVDNNFIGETPISSPVMLSAGEHLITFVHPSFNPIVQVVNVQPDKQQHISANFIEDAGFLNCIVIPWAEVYINEQYKGTTPLEKPILLSSGKYTVRFKNNIFADIVRDVTIKPKDTLQMQISFEKK